MTDPKQAEKGHLRFWQAFLIALLVHLLLAWLLGRTPEAFASYFQLSPEQLQELAEDEEPPLRFEFVDIPDEPEAEPEKPSALSDRFRRARGQEPPEPEPDAQDPDPFAEGSTSQKIQVPLAPEVEEVISEAQPEAVEGQVEEEPAAGEDRAAGAQPDLPSPERAAGSGAGGRLEPVPEGVLPRSIQRLSERELHESFDNPAGTSPLEIGTISFDTAAIDWGPYARRMMRIIRRNWIDRMPPAFYNGIRGVAVVNFRIAQDGSISNVSLIDSYGVRAYFPGRYQITDGVRPFENTAMEAIEVSELPPLPDIFTHPDVGLTIGFFYGLRAPR